MSDKLQALIARQKVLQAEAANQRQMLSVEIQDWHRRLHWFDRALATLGFVRRHPALLMSVGAAMVYMIPNRSGKTFLGVYALVKGLRKFLDLFSKDAEN